MQLHICRSRPVRSAHRRQLGFPGRDAGLDGDMRAGHTSLQHQRRNRNRITCSSISTTGSSKATRFQVEHQTFIPVGREQFWRLLKELTPTHKWDALAPAFACLESIYRVEYNLVVEEALKAYRDANNATVPTPTIPSQGQQSPPPGSRTGPPSHPLPTTTTPKVSTNGAAQGGASTSSNTPTPVQDSPVTNAASTPSMYSRDKAPVPAAVSSRGPIPQDSRNATNDGLMTAAALSSRPQNAVTSCDDGDVQTEQQSIEAQLILTGQQVEQELQQAGQELVETIKTLDRMAQEASQQQAEWEAAKKLQEEAEQEAAEKLWQLDRKFMELVWYLSVRAHFAPLGLRDILLSRSLNSDYLWQLFIKAGPYRLDNSLITALVNPPQTSQPAAPDNGSRATNDNGSEPRASSSSSSSSSSSNGAVMDESSGSQFELNHVSNSNSRLNGGDTSASAGASSAMTQRESTNNGGLSHSSRAVAPPWEEELTFLQSSRTHQVPSTASRTISSLRSSSHDSSVIRLASMSSLSLQSWAALRREWAELPDEAQHVLVLKRAYGQDVQSGRLIVQKLDYLQLLLVRSLWNGMKDTVMAVVDDVRQFWSNRGVGAAGGQSYEGSSESEDGVSDVSRRGEAATNRQSGTDVTDGGEAMTNGTGLTEQRLSEGMRGERGHGVQQLGSELVERAKAEMRGWVAGLVGSSQRSPAAEDRTLQAGQYSGTRAPAAQKYQGQTAQQNSSSSSDVGENAKGNGVTLNPATAPPVKPVQRKGRRRRPVLQRLYGWGRMAGGAAVSVLVDWGLLPQLDVPTLAQVNKRFPVKQERGAPVTYLEKQSLEELFGGWNGFWGLEGPVRTFLSKVEVLEPTYKEMLVLYRNRPKRNRLRTWVPTWVPFLKPPTLPHGPIKRPPIMLRIYHDIPMPTWKVVYPDKLLQFRPLDLIRLDLFAFAGIGAAVAQARYDSIILDFVTLTTFTVLAIRVTLGYKRMVDRYENSVNELLREKTVAGNEGAVEYLGSSASLQQFKQAALAYALLAAADVGPLDADEVARRAEKVILQASGQQVRFDVHEALGELKRLGLLHQYPPSEIAAVGIDATAVPPAAQTPPYAPHLIISDPSTVQFIVKGHWERLLWQRVDKVLQSIDEDVDD